MNFTTSLFLYAANVSTYSLTQLSLSMPMKDDSVKNGLSNKTLVLLNQINISRTFCFYTLSLLSISLGNFIYFWSVQIFLGFTSRVGLRLSIVQYLHRHVMLPIDLAAGILWAFGTTYVGNDCILKICFKCLIYINIIFLEIHVLSYCFSSC